MEKFMPNCPRCHKIVKDKPNKNWKFSCYKVQRYECKSCGTKFNFYTDEESQFTIPKPRAIRKKK